MGHGATWLRMPVLRSAARRARQAQENPAAAEAEAAAPAPPPVRRRRAERRRETGGCSEAAAKEEERREEEIKLAEVSGEGNGEKRMVNADSAALSADKQAVEDEGTTTPVPETVRCFYHVSLVLLCVDSIQSYNV